jgi:protein-disulfide isomerase
MLPSRGARVLLLAAVALSGKLGGCGAPGGLGRGGGGSADTLVLQVPGLDPTDLTTPERRSWSAFVTELPAPCPELDATLKQCVKEQLSCQSCVPAVKFLYSQVQRGKTAAQIESAYELRFSPDKVRELDLQGAPRRGAKNPDVLIATWSDFECSACGAAAPLLDHELKAYPKHVALTYLHYPILRHQRALRAARAAVAADRQGKFWRMHDLMYSNQHLLEDLGLIKLARQAGLDLERFDADRRSDSVGQVIARDRARADALGLTGTPMIYVNGRYFDFDHFRLRDDLDDWIRLEIEIRTGAIATPLPVDDETWPSEPSAAEVTPVQSDAGVAPIPSDAGVAPIPSDAGVAPIPSDAGETP